MELERDLARIQLVVLDADERRDDDVLSGVPNRPRTSEVGRETDELSISDNRNGAEELNTSEVENGGPVQVDA